MKASHGISVLAKTAILLSFAVFLSPADAHPPKAVQLAFDTTTNVLNVTITHGSHFPSAHYITTVDIKKNGKTVRSQAYTEQPKTSPFTYSYEIQAEKGDLLEVTATCNVFGSTTSAIRIPRKIPIEN